MIGQNAREWPPNGQFEPRSCYGESESVSFQLTILEMFEDVSDSLMV
jgi:hypothetical protein